MSILVPAGASNRPQARRRKRRCRKAGLRPRHIYSIADAGRMPAPVRLASLVRWDLDEIDRWIAAGCPSLPKGASR